MKKGFENSALVLIDFQQAFLEMEEAGARRNNPEALTNARRLLTHCRGEQIAIFHVRHASTETGSCLRRGESGYETIIGMEESGGEPVLLKSVNSAFIGTDLERRLREGGKHTLFIAGITTNHCVETTTRMAGNLGFDARLVEDACYTFDRIGFRGQLETAEAVHTMSLSNLAGEFATIETTAEVVAKLTSKSARRTKADA
ncbi:MAG TPA: cysteine hydrolase [Aurantimonas coralicida]|uniref:Cysteine hydrolase n=2 Tax=root TaxID=1 RepID=A0A9C9NC20_9HYPH|nr:cysteine hydrolase [Aurantimonas coralicida]HET99269.1 cysteine hydrolase [Aurantimonas coralicida]